MTPILWQRIEGALVFVAALSIAVMIQHGWPVWVWLLVLLAPDISMLGYLAGPRIGALAYNAVHLYAWGLLLALFGISVGKMDLIALGVLWTAHVGIDRALGYGLKEATGFRDTHLNS